MSAQNKNQNKGQPPQEANDLQNEVDQEVNRILERQQKQKDPFERQFEKLLRSHQWPIDWREPGFPQIEKNDVKEQPIDVIPGFPLFAERRRQRVKEPFKEPQKLGEDYNKWSKEEQQKFIEDIQLLFPDMVVAAEEVKIPPEDNEEQRQMNRRIHFRGGRHWRKRQELLLQRIIEEQNKEFAPKVNQIKKFEKILRPEYRKELTALVNRGLKNNTEIEELKRLKVMMKDMNELPKEDSTPPKNARKQSSVLPSAGKYHLEDFEPKLLRNIFEKFTFQGLLILCQLSPKWEYIFDLLFEFQSYLWFCNENENSRRFLPIEDCCEECHIFLDSEPVIRVLDNRFENRLIKVIDCVLFKTKNLKCLRLYRFKIDQILIIKKLCEKCPQLIHLDLTECYAFTLAVIQEFCHSFPNIEHLILSATDINEEMFAHLTQSLKSLVTLVVSSTLITGEGLHFLIDNPNGKKRVKTLKRLDIRCCPLLKTSALIQFIKNCGYIPLQHLKIDGYKDTQIYALIWMFFKKSLLLLEITELYRDSLDSQSYIWDIPLMTNIESLKLGKNIVYDSKTFDNFINSCPKMRSFSMEFNVKDVYRLSDQSLLEMSHKWPLLERLTLIRCPLMAKEFIDSLQRLKNLQYLNLTESIELRNDFMEKVIPKLSKVNCLVLDKCLYLGKRTLDQVVKKAIGMSSLMRLSMLKCDLQRLPYIKAKRLPKNLRITYSSVLGQTYVSFDGHRTKTGQMADITQYLNEK